MRYLFVHVTSRTPLYCHQDHHAAGTIVPTKRDSDVIFCLHLLSKKNNLFTPLELTRIKRSHVDKSFPADRINTQVIYRF